MVNMVKDKKNENNKSKTRFRNSFKKVTKNIWAWIKKHALIFTTVVFLLLMGLIVAAEEIRKRNIPEQIEKDHSKSVTIYQIGSSPLVEVQANSILPFVPIDSVYQSNFGSFLYVLENGRAMVREVKLGEVYGQFVMVKEGLLDSDLVILDRSVIEGDKIKVKGFYLEESWQDDEQEEEWVELGAADVEVIDVNSDQEKQMSVTELIFTISPQQVKDKTAGQSGELI